MVDILSLGTSGSHVLCNRVDYGWRRRALRLVNVVDEEQLVSAAS
jgi:limonene-1,2-epoxide hydrolase